MNNLEQLQAILALYAEQHEVFRQFSVYSLDEIFWLRRMSATKTLDVRLGDFDTALFRLAELTSKYMLIKPLEPPQGFEFNEEWVRHMTTLFFRSSGVPF